MKQQKLTSLYVYLMLSVFLFFTGFFGYTAIFSAKTAVFTLLSTVYIILYVIFGLGNKRLSFPETAALVYLLITVISALVSRHFPKTLIGVSRYEGAVTVALYVFIFILVSRSFKPSDRFVKFLAIVMIIESAVVLLQLSGVNVMGLYPTGENYYIAKEKYNGVFISTVGNADISSALFALMSPILSVLAVGYKKYRYLTVPSALLSLASLVLMNVSSGTVALTAVIAVMPVLLSRHRLKAIVITLVIALIILAAVYFLPISEGGVFFELKEIMRGNFDPDFGSGRIHIWSEVIKNTKPLLGTGPDTMYYENITPFVNEETSAVRRIDIAHNDYLNILFHQGIFALLAYLSLLGYILTVWLKNGKNNILATALGAGAFAYMVHTFFSYSACSSAVFFWMVMGMAVRVEKENLKIEKAAFGN